MIEILPGFADNVLAAAWRGKVTAEEYQKVLEPAVRAKVAAHGGLRLLAQFGKDFDAMTPGAMWQDSVLGISHWGDFGRIAVVTDIAWIESAVRMFSPFFHHPVRLFAEKDFAAAKAWIESAEAAAGSA